MNAIECVTRRIIGNAMPYSVRPRESDTLCPDRFPCYGWRRICKGGYIRWYGHRYYHEDLAQWEDMFVYIQIADWLAVALEVQETGSDGRLIIAKIESDADYRARKGIVIPKASEIQDGLEIQDPVSSGVTQTSKLMDQ